MDWPSHPQPQFGESLTSWVIRQAFANSYSVHEFTNGYLGKKAWFDFDFLNVDDGAFNIVSGHIRGGPGRTAAMTFALYEKVLGGGRKLTSWRTPPSKARRYCPKCLEEDSNPFLRLSWRINFISVCTRHAVVLQSNCPGCLGPFRPTSPNPYYDLTVCGKCGSSLSNPQPEHLDEEEPLLIVTRSLEGVIQGDMNPYAFGWPFSSAELFESLLFLVKFLRYLSSDSSLQRGQQLTVFWNLPISRQLLTDAWQLLHDSKALKSKVNGNKKAFRRFVVIFGCPASLKRILA